MHAQQKPVMFLKRGHSGMVSHISYSRNGDYLASAGQDKTMRLWDTRSGRLVKTFAAENSNINGVDISPDGTLLASANSGGLTEIREAQSMQPLKQLKGDGLVSSYNMTDVAFSPNGKYVAASMHLMKVFVWEVASGKLMRSFRTNGIYPNQIVFSSDGSHLAVASYNSPAVFVFDVAAGTSVQLQAPGRVTSLDASKDFIAAGCHEGQIQLWSRANNAPAGQLKAHRGTVSGLAFSPGGSQLASAGDAGELLLHSTTDQQLLQQRQTGLHVTCLAFSPEGTAITLGTITGEIRTFMASALQPLPVFDAYGTFFSAIAVGDNSNTLVAGNTSGEVKFWDLASARLKKSVRAHAGPVTAVYMASQQHMALSSGYDGKIILWDVATATQRSQFQLPGEQVTALTVAPGGKWMAGGTASGKILLWQPGEARPRHIAAHQGSIKKLQFHSGTGQLFSLGEDNKIKVWKPEDGTEAFTWLEMPQKTLDFGIDPGGEQVVVVADPERWDHTRQAPVYLYEYSTGKGQTLTFQCESSQATDFQLGRVSHSVTPLGTTSAAFSKSGSLLAVGGKDHTIKIWNLASGGAPRSLRGHVSAIGQVAFSQNGKFFASAADDGTLAIWDQASLKKVATLVAGTGDNYLIKLPDNHYTSSKGNLEGVGFAWQGRQLPWDQFDMVFNRTDLVLQALGGNAASVEKYHQVYQKRLSKMGVAKADLDQYFNLLPRLQLQTSGLPLEQAEKFVELPVSASDARYPLQKLHVLVNNVPVFGTAGKDIPAANSQQFQQKIRLELSQGQNYIQVYATNSRGIASLKEEVNIRCTSSDVLPKLHLVCIGVSEHQQNHMNLQFADDDAREIAATFGRVRGFAKVNRRVILNTEATRQNILQMKEQLQQTAVDDYVMIFYAGHGLLHPETWELYLSTWDTDFDHPEKQALPYQELESLLDGIPARQKVLVMDACHSGEFDSEGQEAAIAASTTTVSGGLDFGFVDAPAAAAAPVSTDLSGQETFQLMKQAFADLRLSSGAVVISSASGDQKALEKAEFGGHGAFTHCLLQGLKQQKADLDKDGNVRVSELKRFLFSAVPAVTGNSQQPTTRTENLRHDFVIW